MTRLISWLIVSLMLLPSSGAAQTQFEQNFETGTYQAIKPLDAVDSGLSGPLPETLPQAFALETFLAGGPLSAPTPEELVTPQVLNVQAQSDPAPFKETAGLVVMEAENAMENITRNGISWVPSTTAAGFSGNSYLQALPDTGKSYDSDLNNKSPELKYTVSFEHTGTYYLWVRANAPNSKGDSLHVGLEGTSGTATVRSYIGSQGSFGWSKATMDGVRASFQVAQPGPFTVHVWMREDGLLFDKLLFTQDANFTPLGAGPDESARVSPPAVQAPSVNAVPPFTNQSQITLSGTKPADTSIWINGQQAVALDSSTGWLWQTALSQETLYTFSITAHDGSGQESPAVTVSVTYDITAPVIVFDSPDVSGTADYLLQWRADGINKSRSVTLQAGQNVLNVIEKDAANNETSADFTVTYDPSAVPGPFQETGGLLVIEAEHPHDITNRSAKSWTPGNSLAGFSGDGYFQSGPDTGKSYDGSNALNLSPILSYDVFIGSPGTYYVWLRGYAPGSNGDSVHAGLDNTLPASSDRISFSPAGAFIWSKVTMDKARPTLEIAGAGLHSLQILMREDGFIADKILLTKDPNFTPANLGPAESGRHEEDIPDTTPPTGAVNINGDNAYTASPDVTLSIDGSDTGSGLEAMRFSTDGAGSWTAWEPFAASKNLSLPSGDGPKEVRMQLRDLAGLTAEFTDTIILDTTPPAGSLLINNGNTVTTSSPVTLTLTGSDSGSGVDQMRFSTDNGSHWTGWENFSTSKSLPLPSGDGSKQVQYQLRDKAGLTVTISKTIILDTTAPSAAVNINNGDTYSNSSNVTLANNASDSGTGVADMRFSTDGANTWTNWQTYAASKSLTLPAGQGTKTVFAEFRDGAGFVKRVSDSIIVDSTAPSGTIKINNAAVETASRSVTLALTASDSLSGLDRVRYSVDAGQTWTNWESFSSSKSLTLTNGDGVKTVLYEVRDKALNIARFSDWIVFENGTSVNQAPALNAGGVFTLSLNDSILQEAAVNGLGWAALALAQKFFGTFGDLYDFLIFVPSFGAGTRLSLEDSGNATENGIGSFYLPAVNDISGIGQDLFDYRSFYGTPTPGEFEGLVMLNGGIDLTNPLNRFDTSDLSDPRNMTFFENILTQEILHRFGSYLTSSAGNPLGLLGRDLAHWGVFFDADFSPMDGNDWVDNGNGTFTMARSYYDEAAFIRADTMMPYNDLDLYAMGLLDPGQVNPSFVIDNPTFQGKRLRPHQNDPSTPGEGGPYVDLEISPGVWGGPYYLGGGTVIGGTRRNVSLSDIIALEGARSPAPSAPKTFKVGFVAVTDETEEAANQAGFLAKVKSLQTSFLDFFRTAARNLASLELPSLGLPGGASGFSIGGAVAAPLDGLFSQTGPAPGTASDFPASSGFFGTKKLITPLYWDALESLRGADSIFNRKKKKPKKF